jgi:hypothetical protein
MGDYKVLAPIQHDGEVFVPGDELSESEVGGKQNLQALVDAGVVEKDVDETPEQVEPPPNYHDADMRLGGDSAALLIDLPTPTNVPQPVVIAREPEPGTLGITSPQAAVFKKMQEKVEQEDQLTLADAQEQRDQEQQAAAEALRSAQSGGVQDPDELEEVKATEPTPVTAEPEVPSPAMATGPAPAPKKATSRDRDK